MSVFEITIGNSAQQPSIFGAVLPGFFVAISAGVLLWGLNWLREWLTAKWNRQTQAEVLAFGLATELDRLISACSDVVGDPRMEDPQTGLTEATTDTPTMILGDNLPWSSFPKSLHYRIRALPNKIDAAIKSCAAEGEWGDGPPDYADYFREREFRFAWIGLEATSLRIELSNKYGVEYLDRGSWEPEEQFKGKIAEIERRKEKLANRPVSPFLKRKMPSEELEKRTADLAAALDIMISKQRLRGEKNGT
ncbi:UNVERIFIED_ORG: hypothetical protein J2W66_004380 [Agrobacterium larrymoorei]|nr:hypothetical protein [Agrobacterium larrymoorei]